MEQSDKKNEILKTIMNVEYYPFVQENEIDLSKYMKVPLAEITSLGTAFASLPASFRAFTQTVSTGTDAGLYRSFIPSGSSGLLKDAKDGIGTFGNIVNNKGIIVDRARFIKTTGVPTKVTTTIPYNPAMLFMAVALMSIEKKLDSIQRAQQDIIDFLEQKEKSELKGDLDILSDVLNNYKYNWDNEKYKTNKHIHVQEIRRQAAQKVDFYREQIAKMLNKQSLFHMNQEVSKRLSDAQSGFKNYQLALYLYSFSSFLEVMLLENFDSGYLDSAVHKIDDYSYQYRVLYSMCYDKIEKYAKSSVETHVLSGIANINRLAGNVVAKVPVISKSQIDETLIETGERLDKYRSSNAEQTMDQFKGNQISGAQIFAENIKTINRLYNQPMELLFDHENIYIESVESLLVSTNG